MTPDYRQRNQYLILFSNCIPVEGHSRSIIIDTQRANFHFIPNSLCALLPVLRTTTLKALYAGFDSDDAQVLDEYADFLLEHELAFFTDTPDAFPAMPMQYQYPNAIQNAIIDIRYEPQYNLPGKLSELEALGCQALQVRVYETRNADAIAAICQSLATTVFRYVELVMNRSAHCTEEEALALLAQYPNINTLILYQCEAETQERPNVYQSLLTRKAALPSADACGCIKAEYFSCTTDMIAESMQFNSCLHKKIAIDEQGFIRNCPSAATHFGHAADTLLASALGDTAFQKYWSVTKDKVAVCRDCEFRYICTDCRVYIADGGDVYAKPSKCTYDPYSCTWADAQPAV